MVKAQKMVMKLPTKWQSGNPALHMFVCEYVVTLGGRTLVWLANQQKTNALPTIGWPTYRLANHGIVSGWPSCGWPTINHTMVGQAMVGQPPTMPWLANQWLANLWLTNLVGIPSLHNSNYWEQIVPAGNHKMYIRGQRSHHS